MFRFPFLLRVHTETQLPALLMHKAFGFHSQTQRVHMLAEGPRALDRILIYTHAHTHARTQDAA